MEKLSPGLTPQDFFEVYKLLVKAELLENTTLISGSEILERFTHDLMICKYILLRIFAKLRTEKFVGFTA
jgi:hypothetical protein